jgi:hypothetical protein
MKTNTKQSLISIPGAGYFIVSGNRSSKCFKTAAAAKAARTRGDAI